MSSIDYQHPMQLMELLGLRGWEASQPRVYWGLRRPDELDPSWMAPNAGLGGGAGWGGTQGGYGMTTGGGGGFNSAGVFSNPGVFGFSAAPSAARSFGADVGFQGGGVNTSGQQDTRESQSWGDFLGSVGTGLGFMGPGGFATGLASLAAQNAPRQSYSLRDLIPGIGLYDALTSAGDGNGAGGAYGGDLGGGATSAATGNYGGAALDFSAATPGFGSDGGYQGGNDTGGYDGGGVSDAAADAAYYRGGPVTKDRLIGPNPPGPDDGFGSLKHGEHVWTVEEVEAAGGHGAVMQLREMLRRRR